MYKDTCPGYDEQGQLHVVAGKFQTDGMPLGADGFAFNDAQCVNTDEEIVICQNCGKTFTLGELTL